MKAILYFVSVLFSVCATFGAGTNSIGNIGTKIATCQIPGQPGTLEVYKLQKALAQPQ